MTLPDVLHILFLLLVANGAPVLAARFMGSHFQYPLDLGLTLFDQQRLLGESKTWRGLFAALLLTSLLAELLGISWETGLMVAGYAMLGDLFSSFIKRRLGLAPSSKATGLDQIPEALLPLLYLRPLFALSLADILILLCAFFILDKALSMLLYRLKIRLRPY